MYLFLLRYTEYLQKKVTTSKMQNKRKQLQGLKKSKKERSHKLHYARKQRQKNAVYNKVLG